MTTSPSLWPVSRPASGRILTGLTDCSITFCLFPPWCRTFFMTHFSWVSLERCTCTWLESSESAMKVVWTARSSGIIPRWDSSQWGVQRENAEKLKLRFTEPLLRRPIVTLLSSTSQALMLLSRTSEALYLVVIENFLINFEAFYYIM